MSALVEARSVVCRYQNVVLDGVSVEIEAGSITGVVGVSGAGKSTLARVLTGRRRPDAGAVLYKGSQVAGPTRALQYIPQDPMASFNPRMTNLEIVREPLDIAGLAGSPALEWMRRLRLPEGCERRRPAELSGGERRRLALARALVAGPELVVLAETLSNLDAPVQLDICETIAKLRKNVAFLVISHDFRVILRLSERVIVLYRGRVVGLDHEHARQLRAARMLLPC